MSGKEFGIAVKGIVYNMANIAGCKIPDDKIYINAFLNLLKKLIEENDKFSRLTYEEFITAALFNAAGNFDEKVKIWQNNFNLDYVCEILLKWISYKVNVERKIIRELLIKNILEPVAEPALSDNELIEHCRRAWMRTKDCMFIESRCYDILNNAGNIILSKEQKDLIAPKVEIIKTSIYRKDHQLYYQFDSKAFDRLLSKKIAVAEYFNEGPISEFLTPMNHKASNVSLAKIHI
jgi:hypothetical protein